MAFDTPLLLQGEDLEILPDGTPATDDDSVARTRTENQERAGLNNPGGVPVTPEEAAAGAFDAYGLRPNYAGDGYLDMNGPLGAKLAFTFDAAPGTYDIVVRVANGDPDAARSIALSTDGGLTPAQPTQTTEWFLWETRTFTVTFGGADPDLAVPRRVEIVTDGDNGPNIDAVAIVESGQTVSFFPPVIETTALSAAENALAVGSVLASDGDGQGVTFAITGGADADKFTITEAGDLSFLTAPDFEAPGSAGGSNTYEVEVTATDGMESVAQTVSVVVTDVAETSGMVFDTATITGYSNQDRPDSGPGVTVAPDGRSVTLDGNLWKRAPVDPFTIDDLTVLRVTIEELSPSEIVAIGFDVDGDPFDADGSIYQLAGTQATPNAFTDLRGTSVSADGRTTFEIDLSAHAGATVSSLVLIADDDKAGDGLGAVTFSAVEVAQVEPGNSDPRVVGGGTADFEVPQGGAVEIDLPFVDDDGDPLTYTFDVTLDGAPVDDFPLTETGGTLSGDLGTTPQGAYTIVTTATDGQGGVVATDSFVLEVVAPNQSPVADDDLALEPLSGAVGQAIAPIELADYAFAFTDPEGQTLTLSAEGLPAGLTVDADGRITGTPIAVGDGTFTLVATDPFGASASIEVPLLIDAPSVGDVTVVEAEDFTGLAGDTAFFATGQAGASNDQLIRTVGNKAATVTTDLSANGVAEGWYRVAIDIYDETDGTAEYSLSVGDVQLSAPGATFDDDGTFTNPGINRGNAGQLGNRKRLDFDTPVYVEGGTILTLSGQADGELLRTDRVFFTRIEAPGAAPTDLALAADPVTEGVAGAVVGQLSAVDPDGDDAAIAFSVDAGSPFEVVGTELRLKAGEALDFESAASVDVAVTATDAGGQSTVATVTVAVADANDAPELGAGASLDDIAATVGTESRTDLSVLAATDQDAGDTVTYGVRSGSAVPLPTGIAVVDGELVVADDVPAGSYTIEVFATDGTAESDAVTLTVTVTEAGAFAPLVLQAEDFALVADGDGDPTNDNLIRTATQNPERDDDPATPAPSNPGLPGFNGLGLRPGYTGEGYLDVEGADTGAQATASFTAPAGTYDITLRLANGSDDANPITVSVDGQDLQVTDTRTGEWFQWETRTVTVTLATDGTHTIALNQDTATGAPHIDALAVTETGVAATFPLDTDADVDGNFALDGDTGELSPTQAASINLNVTGLDADIVRIELSFDGGATRTDVTALPDADGDFVFDGSALVAGPQTATVIVTDAAGNEATDDLSFTIAEGDPSGFDPVTIQAEDTGQVAILDDTGNGLNDPRTTQIADDTNPGPFGTLHSGAVGNAYADMGTDPGDALAITLTVPSDGTYTATIRYANGASTDRPMEIAVGGTVVETIDFAPTTGGSPTNWSAWTDVTVDLTLTAGENTITLAIPEGGNNGPNIDQFTFEAKEVGPPVAGPDRFVDVIKVNFEAPTSGNGAFDAPAGYVTPDGFEADTGAAFGDRGNGFTYGWVDVDDATGTVTATPLAQPIGSMRYKATVSEASDLQKTFAHLDYPGVADGDRERAWEIALANGTYELTVAVGDTAGPHDSTYLLNVEGMQFGPAWDPVNLAGETVVAGYSPALDGEGFRSNLHTGIVQVADGRLTIDGIDGTNVELQWLDLQRVPDLTPDDGRTADLDYSKFIDAVAASTLAGQVTIEIGPDGTVPLDIDPTSDIVLGVQLQAIDHRGPAVQFTEGVKLVETLTGVEVPVYVQVTGGADSLTIRPLTDLKEFTSYTLKVEDVLDLGNLFDATAPQRQFQDYTTTFVTGEMPEITAREVAFVDEVVLDGFAEGGVALTSVEFGPDGALYASSITGTITRWQVKSDGTLDKATGEQLALDYFLDGGRSIIGMAFDPEESNVLWVTDNAPVPVSGKTQDIEEFSGRISKITLGPDGGFVGATAETYIEGLPRSGGDHVTNSIEFRANPDAGIDGAPNYLMYFTQGSNSAAGREDNAWGFRPERLLNAAVLEVDHTRDVSGGPFDVQTEPYDPSVNVPTFRTGDPFNTDGTFTGFYDPFADGAVLKIFGEGIRNAYDLVWHSNGQLYVPTNGTAAGGNTLDNPNTAIDEELTGLPKQFDYLFTVEEGRYYGHPNKLQGNYVVNGGNPTDGPDLHGENTKKYLVGTQPDVNWDPDGVYSLGFNKSPNGATEYTGDAFGSNLKGAILFAQFSQGDNVRAITVNPVTGEIIGDDVLRRPDGGEIDDYIDPLDIIEHPVTGQLYLSTLNRATGESKIILLTPAPGGVVSDVTADEDDDLILSVVDGSDAAAMIFEVSGLDSDIETITISFDGGATTEPVTLDADGRFIRDLSAFAGSVTATLVVQDEVPNTAQAQVTFTPGAGVDNTADKDGDLMVVMSDASDRAATVFLVTGVDADIERITVSFDGGTTSEEVTIVDGAFTADTTDLTGEVTVTLTVEDDVANTADATAVVDFDAGGPGGGGDGQLSVSGLDSSAAGDRLVFSLIEQLRPNQVTRDSATIQVTNDGAEAVTITDVAVVGAFSANGLSVGDVIAPGASVAVTVTFDGTDGVNDNKAVLYQGGLTIASDAGDVVVDLGGLAQLQSERGEEPTVEQIVEAFGYSTDMAQDGLANGGRVETIGDEVLMPYLVRLDDGAPVEIVQIAAYLNQGNVARLSTHTLDSADLTELFAADDNQGQTLLPDGHVPGVGDTGSVAAATVDSDDPFGIKITVDGRPTFASWTDPEANRIDPDFGNLVGSDRGHLIRFFQARDGDGAIIEGTFIALQDYPGAGNYDYNDHMFIVKNVRPYDFAGGEDANGNGVNDALETDADGDGTVAFFDPDEGPVDPPDNTPPTTTGITGVPDATEGEAFTFDVSGFFADADPGDVLSFTATLPAGLSISQGGVISGAPMADGSFSVTVTASDGEASVDAGFTLVVDDVAAPDPQAPFPGPAAPLIGSGPVILDAGSFDSGGQGIAWNDDAGLANGGQATRADTDVELVGPDLDIGFVAAGEWVEYTIDVVEAGAYDLSVIARSGLAGNSVAISLEDGPALATFALADGAAFAETGTQTVTLAAGEQTLRVTFDGTAGGDGSLLDYRSLTLDKVEGGVGTDPIGQAGKLVVAQTDAGAWTTVTFDQPLDNPSVVLGPLSFNDADPATLRVRDVTDTGFQFQIDEWDYLDGIHGAETIQWLALEQGVHEVGGQTIAAGSSTASGNGSLIQLEGTSFGSAPVVLAQIASDNGAAAATAQIESVSNGSFRLDLDREEAASSAHGTEQVDWIAVTPGGDGSDGLQAGSVTRVQDGGKTISLMNGDTDEFVFLSSMQGERIRDAATVRLESQTDDSWRVFIEEEQSLDAETSHGNEKVGYLGIELGLIYADDLLA